MRSKTTRVLAGLGVAVLSLVIFYSFGRSYAQAATHLKSNKTTSHSVITNNVTHNSSALVTTSAVNPQLGAHVLYAQDDTVGTNPAVTPAIITSPSGSTLLAISMGWLRNISNPVDTFNNTWSQISGPNIYFSPDFYTAVWSAPAGIGGSGHTLTFAKDDYPGGEISQALIEVKNGGKVSQIYKLAPGSNQTPGSITVDGPATLVAIWAGDSGELEHTAVPDNGFAVIDSYLSFGSIGATGVQVAIASKEVTTAGTYTVRWTSNPVQNCACYLIAVQNSSLPPTSTFTITSTAGAGGMISPAGSVVLASGTNQTFTVTPNSGFQIADVLVDGVSQGNISSFTFSNVTADHTISASFSQIPVVSYTITSTAGTGGTISPAGSVALTQGSNQAFSITASSGFQIANVLVDGISQGAISTFTFTNISANHTISATFSLIPSDTTPPTGTIIINGGAASTTQTAVILTLSATDDSSGVVQMRFSNDGTNFSTPTTYSTTAAWTLTSGSGLKTVYAQFLDGAGNWSTAVITDTINLASTTPASGLVAYYNFNEGQGTVAADTSGNSLNGTMANATWAAGKHGSALLFKGQSTSRVTVANSALLQLPMGFTLSAWVNPQASQVTEPMIIGKEISGNLSYVLYAKGSGVGPNVYTFINGDYQTTGASSLIPANTWTYLTATYDGATLSIYVNGVLVSNSAVSGNITAGTGALRIGNNSVFGSEGFKGLIDDVRIYNHALSALEIQANM